MLARKFLSFLTLDHKTRQCYDIDSDKSTYQLNKTEGGKVRKNTVIILLIMVMLLSLVFPVRVEAEGGIFGKLETGDILLFQSKAGEPFYWFNLLLQNAFGCEYSHVALYWGNGLIVGTGGSGVQFSLMEQVKGSITKILRCHGLTEQQKQTMRINSMATIGTPYPNLRGLTEMGLTFLKYFTIENPLLKAIAKPIFDLVALFLGINQGNRIFTNLNSSDGWNTVICTEFVARMFEKINISLDSHTSPDFLLPDDFLKFSSLTEVR